MSNVAPRYTDYEFPPYTYVPGVAVHPMRADGHQCLGPRYEPLDCFEEQWRECATYLWGIDLFNRGFYWEAHEAWEAVWRDMRRDSMAADWCKGLIKLAAAGVKIREGRIVGMKRHANRAAELFATVHEKYSDRFAGLSPDQLRQYAQSIASEFGTSSVFPFKVAANTHSPTAINVVSFALTID